jgi:hypothetical protein
MITTGDGAYSCAAEILAAGGLDVTYRGSRADEWW